jgi:hypothetical protein
MLQTQHAIASQNWQRIEGSIQHRNEALEKEKLELLKKLDDEKRKLHEAVCPPSLYFLRKTDVEGGRKEGRPNPTR